METTATTTPEAFKLHLEEYKALRAEIASLQSLRILTAQIGLPGVVAVLGYQFSRQPCDMTPMQGLAWFLPAAIAVAAQRLTDAIGASIRHGASYLSMIEAKYADADLLGFHHRLRRMRPLSPKEIALPAVPEDNETIKALASTFRIRNADRHVSGVLKDIWSWTAMLAILIGLFGCVLTVEQSQHCPTQETHLDR